MCVEFGMKSQFIADDPFYESPHTKQRNIVSGMMDDVVYKLGSTTYMIDPHLTMGNNIININKTLILGLDVCHPTNTSNNKYGTYDRPSIAVLTALYGDMMAPNVKQQKSCMYLNNRVEICGYKQMTAMVTNVLKQQLLGMISMIYLNLYGCSVTD